MDPGILELGIPVLGICYGQQLMAQALGGEVAHSDIAEYGKTELRVDDPGVVLDGTPAQQTVWMSHRDAVVEPPPGSSSPPRPTPPRVPSSRIATGASSASSSTPRCPTPRTARRCCGASSTTAPGSCPTWTPLNVIDEQVGRIRDQVGDRPVLCGLSGGVDSSVAAALVHRAVGDQLTCVFVDHGLMRHDEGPRSRRPSATTSRSTWSTSRPRTASSTRSPA
jgi:GMP synthase (glutamine-hydrolysing)